ncbi:MAG: MFS transporter [Deltaproteobacteria bacterium]|nr:MFS transporter [Deltaproteobacteria bacterium]MDQ3296785.1 MFS transporter [Myxococcota bacterium]
MPNRQLPWWKEPTKGQWAAFSAAWAGWVLDAFDFTIFLMVQNEIAKEFGVGLVSLSGSVTLTLIVRLAGGWVAGWMADKWGRKLPLMLSLLWFAVFDAAIYFAPSFMWVVILRTIFGFGMGAEWTAGTAMAMENWPVRSRKIASGLLQAGWPIGFLLSAAVAHFVVPTYGWRAMFLIAAVPALLVFPIRFLVPDELSGKPVKGAAARSSGTFKDLMAPGIRQAIVLGSLVMGLGFLVYYGLTANYVPMLVGELGLDRSAAWFDVILFNLGMLVGVVAAGWVANRHGVVVALVAPALLMIPALPLYVGAVPALLPLGAFLGGALGVGYSGVTPVLTTSLFPDHVRGRAIGVVYHVGAMIGAFAPVAISQLAARTELKLSTAIALVAGISLLGMSLAVIALRKRIVVAVADHRPEGADHRPETRAEAATASSTGLPPPAIAVDALIATESVQRLSPSPRPSAS